MQTLHYDGFGLNRDDEYKTRVLTFVKDVREDERQAIVGTVIHAKELLQALKELTEAIDLSKLNIRKDVHLLNVHACASRAIHKAEGKV